MNKNELKSLHVIIHRALEEDLGDGDITTLSTVPARSVLKGTFIAKESGIIAGLEVVRETLKYLDPRSKIFCACLGWRTRFTKELFLQLYAATGAHY